MRSKPPATREAPSARRASSPVVTTALCPRAVQLNHDRHAAFIAAEHAPLTQSESGLCPRASILSI
jgi:hypothetical protein